MVNKTQMTCLSSSFLEHQRVLNLRCNCFVSIHWHCNSAFCCSSEIELEYCRLLLNDSLQLLSYHVICRVSNQQHQSWATLAACPCGFPLDSPVALLRGLLCCPSFHSPCFSRAHGKYYVPLVLQTVFWYSSHSFELFQWFHFLRAFSYTGPHHEAHHHASIYSDYSGSHPPIGLESFDERRCCWSCCECFWFLNLVSF